MQFNPKILVISAILISFAFTGLTAWYARRRGILNHPGDRHSHAIATPTGGGLGIILALLLMTPLVSGLETFWVKCVLPGVIVLSFVGWQDDRKSLSARFRLLVQFLACVYLVFCASAQGWVMGTANMLAAIVALLWASNLYNFMDGSNGMAGLEGLFTGFVLSWLFTLAGESQMALISALIAAACMGFLPWNMGRARVFMGDVGSVTLGYVFAALLLAGVWLQAFSIPIALMVMLVFVTDSTLTLLGRIIKGERWYNAHKQHLYQRLIVRGWTHGRVALVYQTINLTLVVPGILLANRFSDYAWLVVSGMTLLFCMGWYFVIKRIGVFAQAD